MAVRHQTSKVGVALVTSGPGATNALTGITTDPLPPGAVSRSAISSLGRGRWGGIRARWDGMSDPAGRVGTRD